MFNYIWKELFLTIINKKIYWRKFKDVHAKTLQIIIKTFKNNFFYRTPPVAASKLKVIFAHLTHSFPMHPSLLAENIRKP